MTAGFMDRNRAAAILAGLDIDALVVTQPENFRYVTGAHPGFPSSWRRATTQLALIPAEAAQKPALVVPDAMEHAIRSVSGIDDVRTHPVWTDHVDLEPYLSETAPAMELLGRAGGKAASARPATFDAGLALGELHAAVRERGLGRGRLAVEMDFIPATDLEAMRRALPAATIVDGSEAFRLLRLIKSAREIHLLQLGAELAELGIEAVIASMKRGMTARDLSIVFQTALLAEARARPIPEFESSWTVFTCGGALQGGASSNSPLTSGDVVKLDCGCSIGGYISDVARTVVFGSASSNRHARSVYAAVHEAWNAGRAKLVSGRPLRDVHEAAQSTMRSAGYRGYTRGHVGHSIGSTVWNEEWPYISADEETIIEANMVFAYEVPVFINGVGAITIEDHILIGPAGNVSMNALSRDYREVPA